MSAPPFLPPAYDDKGRQLDAIQLTGLSAECIVGVYPGERTQPQPVKLDVALYLDTREAAAHERIRATVDYARLAGELRFLLHACRFLMLETAAEALCRYVLAPPTEDLARAQVQAATIRLAKPHALAGIAEPALEVHRRAREFQFAQEQNPWGKVDVLHETGEYGIYRLRLKPGGTIPTHVHRIMEEHELVLGGGLLLQGAPVKAGTAIHWPHDAPHRYDNPTATEQTVLCVDLPKYIAADEIHLHEQKLSLPQTKRFYPAEEP